jgi:hypothetical protein
MVLTISIPEDVATKLGERAAASGKAVPEYASQLVEQAVKAPTIDELLEPVRADFARTGMSEQEIMELGSGELKELRAERKAKSA